MENLIQKYKENNSLHIRNKIVEECMPIVDVIIYKYHRNYRDTDDLRNEGVFGIIRALDLYDATKKCNFNSYAFYQVRSSLQNYVYKTEGIVQFINKSDYYRSIHLKIRKYFGCSDLRKISTNDIKEFSEHTNVPTKYIDTYILSQTCNMEIVDYTTDYTSDSEFENLEFSDKLMSAILDLNKKDRDVLASKYYYAVNTVKNTMAKSSYNYIHNRAIEKLKEKLL